MCEILELELTQDAKDRTFLVRTQGYYKQSQIVGMQIARAQKLLDKVQRAKAAKAKEVDKMYSEAMGDFEDD